MVKFSVYLNRRVFVMERCFFMMRPHLTLSARQTLKQILVLMQTVNPDEIPRDKPSHQDLQCFPCSPRILTDDRPFATTDVTKFKDGSVDCRNTEMKGCSVSLLSMNHKATAAFCSYIVYVYCKCFVLSLFVPYLVFYYPFDISRKGLAFYFK